ncbi:MAG: type 4a pilus biogenesis protein PilO [Steroidobacteraceae bacterium]|jgi:type IV pilus assembly protein PilO|nr:type 4a pilus biogenesis protein PilO [Steroidobacteraceae bacterium]
MRRFIEELRTLDPKDVGRWPGPVRGAAVALIFVAATIFLIYVLVWNRQVPELELARKEEQDLMKTFDEKQRKAANFEAYTTQLREMERSFGAMLRQLPGRTEVPNLLVDISQTGLAAGLEEELFQPAPEVRKDFYAELPIKIRLTGSYHEFGSFVSGIAALPRIVTLHDIAIVPQGKDAGPDDLTLDVTAKTYRYLDEAEESEDSAAPAASGARPRTTGAG